MEEKLCKRCGVTKPLSKFYKRKRAKDGHYNICKECEEKRYAENERKRESEIMSILMSNNIDDLL